MKAALRALAGAWRLAWRSLTYHRGRTFLLVLCVMLVAVLPLATELLVRVYQASLTRRATQTPLVVGAPGSRFDLLVAALYFRPAPDGGTLPAARVAALRARTGITAVPLVLGATVQGYPVVGTSLDYFAPRALHLAAGRWPALLGETVLGARLAAQLGRGVDDTILTDTRHLYTIGASIPLRLRVVGVFAPGGEADDGAAFVDTKTAWVIAGIGHGHQDLARATDREMVLARSPGEVTASGALFEYPEITPENLASFHFHGDPGTFPVHAIVVWPDSPKARTLARAALASDATALVIEPGTTLAELLAIAYRVKRLFDANLLLVSIAMALLLGLVVLLSLRVRARELETLMKIGCSRAFIALQQGLELFVVIALGLALAAALAAAGAWWVLRGWGG